MLEQEKREIKSFLFRNKESRKKYFETFSATMGAPNCKVYNDTKEKIKIYAFSYSDGIRLAATTTHILSPGQTKEFKAGADGRGM